MAAAPSRDGPVTVIGFPPAGVGASFFHPVGGEGLAVHGIDLPGRETRAAEPPCDHLACVVDAAARSVSELLLPARVDDSRIVLAGHSFGAIVAWQVAARLTEHTDLLGRMALVVSGSPSPYRRRARLGHLPDEALLTAVSRLTGHAHPGHRDAQLRGALVRALRADLSCLAALPLDTPPVDVPIHVVRGAEDPVVTGRDLEGWRRTSRRRVDEEVVPGGHMHPRDDPLTYSRILQRVGRGLEVAVAAPPGPRASSTESERLSPCPSS